MGITPFILLEYMRMKRVDAECRDADPGGVDPDPRDKKGSGFNLHESLDPERHAKMEPGFDQIN